MRSPRNSGSTVMRRHDLAIVRASAWRSLVHAREDLEQIPLVAGWVDNGWPLIGRRALPGERGGVTLGLPLPPFAGKRRLSFVMRREDILRTAPPPPLGLVSGWAPTRWRPTMDRIVTLSARHSVEARLFGSLAWRALTGLNYLTDRSDLDLLLQVNAETDIPGFVAELARIEGLAPMRLDGELIRRDGAAVNWREVHSGAGEILVKSPRQTKLMDASLFLRGASAS